MDYKTHGSIAIVLVLAGIAAAGAAVLVKGSIILLAVYTAAVLLSIIAIVAAYCRKCYKRNRECVHFNVGKLSVLMPPVDNRTYTRTEYLVTVCAVLLITGFPQYFLIQHRLLFVLFWVLTAAGVIEIFTFVCTDCRNGLCVFCRNSKAKAAVK